MNNVVFCCHFKWLAIGMIAGEMLISIILLCIGLVGLGSRNIIFSNEKMFTLFVPFCVVNSLVILMKLGFNIIMLNELLKLNKISPFLWTFNVTYIIWLVISLIWTVMLPFEFALFYGLTIACICGYYVCSSICLYRVNRHTNITSSMSNILTLDNDVENFF